MKCKGPLSRCGNKLSWVQFVHAEIAKVEVEPFNSCGSEDDGIVPAFFQMLDSGGDVASEGLYTKVGPEEKELIPAAHG